jgi:hypothetical protein
MRSAGSDVVPKTGHLSSNPVPEKANLVTVRFLAVTGSGARRPATSLDVTFGPVLSHVQFGCDVRLTERGSTTSTPA